MSEKKIIEGSENWAKRVPDEYAIRCIERFSMPGKTNKYLVFYFVEPVSRVYGSGFAEGYGMLELDPMVNAILIAQDDLTSPPAVFVKKNFIPSKPDAGIDDFELIGVLQRINYELVNQRIADEPDNTVEKPEISKAVEKVSFRRTVYYSGRRNERQRSDSHAPVWLREFADRNFANVALFEL